MLAQASRATVAPAVALPTKRSHASRRRAEQGGEAPRARSALAPQGSRVQNVEVSSLFGTVTLLGDCLFAFARRKLRFSRSFTFAHQTQIEFVSKANGVVSLLAKASPQIFLPSKKASLLPCKLMR